MIHDKTDTPHWSDRVEDWQSEFDHNDVIVALDPQERLGEGTIVVSRIDMASREHVEHFGLFWTEREARRYARSLDSDVQESREKLEALREDE